MVDLRGDPGDAAFAAAVAGVTGTAPPGTPNTVAAGGVASLLWLGPDQWLAVGSGADLASRLESALAGFHHSVCDVSSGRQVLELAGPEARAVLAKGMSLDLHPRAFKSGGCAQTALARVPVVLQQLDDDPALPALRPPVFRALYRGVAWRRHARIHRSVLENANSRGVLRWI